MASIHVLLDRHFPYSLSDLKNSKIKLKKLGLPARLPTPVARIFHVLDLYRQSFEADVILGNRRSVLLLGLLYQVYKPKKISLIGYEIIFNFKNTFKHNLVKWIWRVAVSKIDRLVVMTNNERQYLSREFNTHPDKFKTIPFYAEEPEFIGPTSGGYIFAAGRMERDFETLLKSVAGTDYPAIIVAEESQKERLESLRPPNAKILYNIAKEEYLKLLKNSKLVVVPLYQGAASRGQVVILEAMKYGKPVVCSKVNGTLEYIQHGRDGLFVEASNPVELREIFDLHFNDMRKLEELGKEAFQTQQNQFSPARFHENYRELITGEYAKKNLLGMPDLLHFKSAGKELAEESI